jgi:hypothetical protein
LASVEKWLTADVRAKLQSLEIVCLNFRLVDVTLVPQIRKPFDVLAEGLVLKNSRGDSLRPIVDENRGYWTIANRVPANDLVRR